MRRPSNYVCPVLTLVLVLSSATSGHAQTAEGNASYVSPSCAQLVTPLGRRLAEARTRLEQVGRDGKGQAEQSRLLSELLSGEDEQNTLTMILTCLTGERG